MNVKKQIPFYFSIWNVDVIFETIKLEWKKNKPLII